MGLIKIYADFLAASKTQGVTFEKTVTLGRLENYLRLDSSMKNSASPVVTGAYADAFFHSVLKTRELDALDRSDYEGANIIHDLNDPLPEILREKYDAVVDGGTLEHVFDLPAALLNCISLLKTGGSLFICAPANNLFGHGFYQFSPELFYRALGPPNGCRIEKMALAESYFTSVEQGMRKRCYEVIDPASIRERANLISRYPCLLLVHAVKHAPAPDKLSGLQSDYAGEADELPSAPAIIPRERGVPSFLKSPGKILISALPRAAEQWMRSRYQARLRFGLKSHPCFRPAPRHFFAEDWLDPARL